MTKKSKLGGMNSQNQSEHRQNTTTAKTIPSSGDAKKTKSMTALLGIEPFPLLLTTPRENAQRKVDTGKIWADLVEEEPNPKPSMSKLQMWSKIVGGIQVKRDSSCRINVRKSVRSQEEKVREVEEGVLLFDRKPIVVKTWKTNCDVTKETINRVPVWVQLPGLNIKYWGKATLTKIASLIGKSLRADRAISNKQRMTYARF
ncbi:hypothetical protein FXO38_06284 [Capsicum annuum]|nr:hypothetical protein FXO38_06284 [Capsicum annuum]